MSSTKYYGTNAHHGIGIATDRGKRRYFKNELERKLTQRNFNRIVLVDRSTQGESLDGFRRLWEDLLDVAKARYNPPWNNNRINRLKQMEMVFINIVDWNRRQTTVAPTSDRITQIAKITVQSDGGAIDTLLRDNDPHPRLQPDYPPRVWEASVDAVWGTHDDGSGRKTSQINRIKNYNRAQGRGLINKRTNTDDPEGLIHVLND